jgi:hypothetical protein
MDKFTADNIATKILSLAIVRRENVTIYVIDGDEPDNYHIEIRTNEED